jgi:hypothetical protein
MSIIRRGLFHLIDHPQIDALLLRLQLIVAARDAN